MARWLDASIMADAVRSEVAGRTERGEALGERAVSGGAEGEVAAELNLGVARGDAGDEARCGGQGAEQQFFNLCLARLAHKLPGPCLCAAEQQFFNLRLAKA